VVGQLAGPLRSLLAIERTALNFLQHLSGIATLTATYVSAVQGTRAAIYDTRKTTPGWRFLEKYAVRCGGGINHRFGLYDAVLIKDNHLAWIKDAAGLQARDPFATAIASARKSARPGTTIEIEVDSLGQLELALAAEPDIVLLDNFTPEHVAQAVRLRDTTAPQIKLEASGGVNLASVRALAETGVDRISVGALTHSAPALDLALDYEGEPPIG
jgi:nicotinate-nucleotide pyrophosphorylase (carboxylating)